MINKSLIFFLNLVYEIQLMNSYLTAILKGDPFTFLSMNLGEDKEELSFFHFILFFF